MNDRIRPFVVAVEQEAIDDLHARLDMARWPDDELVSDWSQGVPIARMRDLAAYWRHVYDWRRCERKLNMYQHFLTEIDGCDIHFVHVRSKDEGALPLLLLHGWPGSFIDYMKIVDALANPLDDSLSFHVVIASLPGFGFSGHPRDGWTVERMAYAFEELMQRLGYDCYVVSGGDVGAAVASTMGQHAPVGMLAMHTNQPFVLPEPPYEDPTPEEQSMLESMAYMGRWGGGYAAEQSSRPQTVGYALADSPVGQAAWIYEKYWDWSDCHGDPETVFSKDDMLDNISLYWFTNTATSAARFYWYNWDDGLSGIPVRVPVAVSVFPKEIYRAPRTWCERYMDEIIYWNELPAGGHFAAFERPELYVSELRKCFASLR